MRKIIVVLAATAIVTGCVTAEQRAQRAADMQRDMALARQFAKQEDFDKCIEGYKTKMHDPSSFELAGQFTLDDVATRVWYGTTWDHGPARRVVYAVNIRGRNTYGGLILKTMLCHYGVYSSGITYWDSSSI